MALQARERPPGCRHLQDWAWRGRPQRVDDTGRLRGAGVRPPRGQRGPEAGPPLRPVARAALRGSLGELKAPKATRGPRVRASFPLPTLRGSDSGRAVGPRVGGESNTAGLRCPGASPAPAPAPAAEPAARKPGAAPDEDTATQRHSGLAASPSGVRALPSAEGQARLYWPGLACAQLSRLSLEPVYLRGQPSHLVNTLTDV